MKRVPQKSNSHGSLKDLQILINKKYNLLNKIISEKLGKTLKITWVSPLKEDEFAEYRDEGFLNILDIKPQYYSLSDFWPKGGPQWDALGKTNNTVFLVEAKANIPEIVSKPSYAGYKSKTKILYSFSKVKRFLNVNNPVDWSGTFYQYANRIAHLYFLKELNKIDTYLVNIYFVNDKSVKGPSSISEWKGAIEVIKEYLGIPKRNKLAKNMIDIFIDLKSDDWVKT